MFVWSEWFSITPYSVIDLLVFATCFPLTAAFYFVYWRLGRRRVDVIFSHCLLCITVIAFGFFVEDNTESPRVALRWAQINFSMVGLFCGLFVHFVFEFLNDRSRAGKRLIRIAYALSLIVVVVTYTPYFYRIRAEPLGRRSWTNVSPTFPEVGWAQIVGVVILIVLTATALRKLHRALSSSLLETKQRRHAKLVFSGACLLAGLLVFDFTLYATTSICTVSFTLLGMLAFCLPAAVVLAEQVVGHNRLKDALSKYVSPQVTDEILSRGLLLESRECEASVLFADIRDFTSIAQELGPKDSTRFLSDYLNKTTAVIFQHRGMLVQTVGDGLFAVFGANGSSTQHELDAIQAGLGLVTALEEFNQERRAAKGDRSPWVRVGIGIHSGRVVLGNVGGANHVDYRVTGCVVNIASRVEQYTKVARHPVLVTQATYAKIKPFVSAQRAGEAPIRSDWSIPVYAVLGLNGREPLAESLRAGTAVEES